MIKALTIAIGFEIILAVRIFGKLLTTYVAVVQIIIYKPNGCINHTSMSSFTFACVRWYTMGSCR